jgi:hypothetical protein
MGLPQGQSLWLCTCPKWNPNGWRLWWSNFRLLASGCGLPRPVGGRSIAITTKDTKSHEENRQRSPS